MGVHLCSGKLDEDDSAPGSSATVGRQFVPSLEVREEVAKPVIVDRAGSTDLAASFLYCLGLGVELASYGIEDPTSAVLIRVVQEEV